MRLLTSATTLAFCGQLFASVPASAQWFTDQVAGDFDGQPMHLAMTVTGNYSIGVRCKGDKAEMIYIVPDKSFTDAEQISMVNAIGPTLRYRIDQSEVVSLDAQLETQDIGLAAIATIQLADINRLQAASRRISVVMTVMGKDYYEQRFSPTGGGRALATLIGGCNLSQAATPKEEADADFMEPSPTNTASFVDVTKALRGYYADNVNDDAVCDRKVIAERSFVMCHLAGDRRGGLFELVRDGEGTKIKAVNGTAKGDIGSDQLLFVDDTMIKLDFTPDQTIDIPAILDKFVE